MASLAFSLLAAPDAHAGTWQFTCTGSGSNTSTYTTGSYPPSKTTDNWLPPDPSSGTSYQLSGFSVDTQPGAFSTTDANTTKSGGGTISAAVTLTWVPAAGQTATTDPPPTSVILNESSSASWTALVDHYPDPYTTGGTSADDGLGDAEVATYYSGVKNGGTSSGSYYSAKSVTGGTLTLNRSFSAQATASSGPSTAGVCFGYSFGSYSLSISPVTISMVGATSDGKGGWDILVGQKCGPFLYGIPSNCTVSNYQWKVSGTTMQSWTVSSDLTHTMEVDGSGPLNQAEVGWFWNDSSQTTETITCTATVTPPVGQGDPFPVTVSQKVGVYLPAWSASGSGGTMNVRIVDTTSFPGGNNTDYWLTSDPISGSGLNAGMSWPATLAPPQGAPVSLGKGNIELVQLITPSGEYINSSNQEYQDGNQGLVGLDPPPGGSWPYGWQTYEDDPDVPDYFTSDSPAGPLSGVQAVYGNKLDSFVDYIMYQPPNSPEYVPLGYFKWNVNGTATIPSTNNWADFKNPAGIVEPSGSYVSFTPSNTYPSWIRNSGDLVAMVPVQ